VDRSLRIAQIAPVATAVRPGAGDSIEQLVGLLCDELVRRGHDVTLYATGDSVTSARLRSVREYGPERFFSPADGFEAVETEAESLPLPGVRGQIVTRWDD